LSFSLRALSALAPALLAAALGCCSYFPPTLLAPSPADSQEFDGLLTLAESAQKNHVRILFVHGIGAHSACDTDTLLKHLGKTLRAFPRMPSETVEKGCEISTPKPIPVYGDNAQTPAELYRYELEGDHQVTFMFLLWSPLTMEPKRSVTEPSITPDTEEFPDPEPILVHRGLLADLIKSFEQDALTDVLLYSGRYRSVIRPAIERGLCRFVDGTPDAHDARTCHDIPTSDIPTAVITHSLGGYIFMDALKDGYEKGGRSERNAATKVGRSLNQIFMLANQIKMLNLTTRVKESGGSSFTREFLEMWGGVRERHGGTAEVESKKQLLAISDPNDILSWELDTNDFDARWFKFANVYLGTTGEVLGFHRTPLIGLAASPIAAHLNYLKDPDVMDIIACGIRGSQIVRCAP
jgi:hypothetical protein